MMVTSSNVIINHASKSKKQIRPTTKTRTIVDQTLYLSREHVGRNQAKCYENDEHGDDQATDTSAKATRQSFQDKSAVRLRVAVSTSCRNYWSG
eukprot:7095374-Pyramimonas_sp.AAC.1